MNSAQLFHQEEEDHKCIAKENLIIMITLTFIPSKLFGKRPLLPVQITEMLSMEQYPLKEVFLEFNKQHCKTRSVLML